MSFFLVDDRCWTHDKVVAVLSADPRPDRGTIRFIAIATWVAMGSYCAGQRADDGRFTLAQASRNLFCDQRRMRMALAMMVDHRMLIDEGGNRYQFHNWDKWRRPKGKRDGDVAPSTTQAEAKDAPSRSRAEAEQRPSTNQAQAKHEPSRHQADTKHEPLVLNDSDGLDPPPYPYPSSVSDLQIPSPEPLSDAREASVSTETLLRRRFSRRYESETNSAFQSSGMVPWKTIARWAERTAELRSAGPPKIIERVVEHWFADEYVRGQNFPTAHFAKHYANYIDPKKPVAKRAGKTVARAASAQDFESMSDTLPDFSVKGAA